MSEASQLHSSSCQRPESFSALVEAARAGSQEALGALLEECRRYLLVVASYELPPAIRAKEAPSDLVQEACLDAQRNFAQFAGQTHCELRGWLRKILIRQVAHAQRRYAGTQKRAIECEAMHIAPGQDAWQSKAVRREPSPSAVAATRERQARLRQCVDALPADFRQVVLFHHHDGLAFQEISQRMDRSEAAVRKLWTRAIKQLQRQLEADDASR